MKKKYLILSITLALLIAGAAIGSTLAYFTSNTYAVGGVPIKLGYSTRVKEDYSAGVKHVVVTNDEGSETVFVRAKAFSVLPLQITGANCSQTPPAGTITDGGEDYYYYQIPLPGTKGLTEDERSTTALDVAFDFPTDPEDEETFNVIVVYESTPAKYDANGNAYADWTTVLDSKTSGGGD